MKILKARIIRFFCCTTIFLMIGLVLAPAYCQPLRRAANPAIFKAADTSRDKRVSIQTNRFILLAGIFTMAAIAAAGLAFAYQLLPKTIKPKTCPAKEFTHAQRITIPLPQGEEIRLKPDSPVFLELVNNFSNETIPAPGYEVYSDKLHLKIGNRRFKVEVSIAGWNFEGEERNSRSLRNPLQVRQIIDSLKDEYSKT